MRYIEVKEVTAMPMVGDPVGIYMQAGCVWAINYPNGAPIALSIPASMVLGEPPKPEVQTSITPEHLLKALAIGQDPQLAKELLN